MLVGASFAECILFFLGIICFCAVYLGVKASLEDYEATDDLSTCIAQSLLLSLIFLLGVGSFALIVYLFQMGL